MLRFMDVYYTAINIIRRSDCELYQILQRHSEPKEVFVS